jgi:uncharacterized membrane protein (UPF0127 family)
MGTNEGMRYPIRDQDSGTTSPSVSTSGLVTAVNTRNGEVLARRVIWAGTSAERRQGLLGRQSLAEDEGIYIVPCQWIHMFGMKFPIDAAFLNSEGRVLAVHHDLRPNRLSRLVFRAEGVLELASGRLDATTTIVGDTIDLV